MNNIVKADKPSTIEFNGASVRMVLDEHGNPWFVAKDLVEAVGATWRGADGVSHIPAEYRGVRSVRTPSGDQEVIVLTEAGMNMYLFRSDKPAALPWQRHLAEEVLPTIRKTGSYSAVALSPARAALALAQAQVDLEERQLASERAQDRQAAKLVELEAVGQSVIGRVQQLEAAVPAPDGFDWMPICNYAQQLGAHLPQGVDAMLGKKATRLSRERKIEIRKVRVPNSVYPTINSYHVSVLREVFGIK